MNLRNKNTIVKTVHKLKMKEMTITLNFSFTTCSDFLVNVLLTNLEKVKQPDIFFCAQIPKYKPMLKIKKRYFYEIK